MSTISALVLGRLRQSYRRMLRGGSGEYVASCRVRDVTVGIGVSSDVEQFRVDTYATKEPETLDWIDRHLAEGEVLYDVGANIGLYSLYAAKRCPGARVISFEPAYHNFARLCRNIARNGCTNILPCNSPLAEAERLDAFNISDVEPGTALHSFGEASAFAGGDDAPALQQWVLSVSLDELVDRYGAPPPNLLKIDVDGIEGQILAGATRVLARPTLRTLLIEWNVDSEGDAAALEDLLAPYGLRLHSRSAWRATQNDIASQNFIFERADA